MEGRNPSLNQEKIFSNIWSGLLNNNVIGPPILPNRVNITFKYRLNCCQHDSAPAYYGIQLKSSPRGRLEEVALWITGFESVGFLFLGSCEP